jgi:hypothetical protein
MTTPTPKAFGPLHRKCVSLITRSLFPRVVGGGASHLRLPSRPRPPGSVIGAGGECLLDVVSAHSRTRQALTASRLDALDEEVDVAARDRWPVGTGGQRLGNHRAAGDDVGGVDVGAHGARGATLGQEPLQRVVDLLTRLDRDRVSQWGRSAQREDELVAHTQAFLQIGLHRNALVNREAILTAAAELMGRRGRNIPLAEIAEAAGVGIGTVYRGYPDRNRADARPGTPRL